MKDELQKERFRLRELARAAAGGEIPDLRELSPREVATLIHEFGVYQMELEAQNEELRETRLALEEARDRYRELYDFAPVGFFTLGRHGEIREANLTGCALLGRTRGELVGGYFSEFLTRQGGDDLYRHLGGVLETGERQVAEVVCPDGRSLRLESVAAAAAGEEAVCRTAVTDISASKAAEASLRESEAVYHGLFADNHAVMLLIDPESGAIVDANRAAAAYYGYPEETLQQMAIFDLHTLPPAKVREKMALARSRGERRFEFRHRLADGAEREVEVYSGPVRRGGRDFLYSIVHDITDRKQAEEALAAAKTAAERASQAKSEFLANMSHEIRTPMTVFMAAIEHLLQIDTNPERRQLLGMAEMSAQRLRTLIDDILDFSRIEARRVELEEEPFDLRALVQSTIEMLGPQAQKKNLRLEQDIDPSISPLVSGDPARVSQILLNLIGNAVKFTHRGEVRVGIQLEGDHLVFAVSDTGIGIPKEKRELIFSSFSQADSSFSRKFGGSGLGLAISKGLVELMGGTIGVEGMEGEGSRFYFTLPFKPAGPAVAVAPAEQAQGPDVPVPRARILVAEDDPMIREMVLMVLARQGWQAETARTGREAVQKWGEGGYDLILMDLQMPEMDGLEATVKIREVEGEVEGKDPSDRTCIVGLTAHARREVTDECLEAGMDQVLIKPVQMKQLFTVVEGCLAERNLN